jgi:hypothetical protein
MSGTEGVYRRVSVRMWGDEKFRQLTPIQPSGQALWLYLLTGPHTGQIPGVFVAGRAALAEALDWELEDFDRCAAELTAQGLVQFDRTTRCWFIPNAVRHNPPANPNVVLGWRTTWALLPEGAMRAEIGRCILAALRGISEPCAKAFGEVLGNPSPKASGKAFAKASKAPSPKQETGNRKQEQEHEHEQENLFAHPADAGVHADDSVLCAVDPKPKGKPESKTAATRTAYCETYRHRYGTDPVMNAKVNAQLARLVDRLGADEAPAVARFYVEHNGDFYVRTTHSVDALLKDCEALRTQWVTGMGPPSSELAYQRSARERVEQVAPSVAARRPGAKRSTSFQDIDYREGLAADGSLP